MSEPIVIVDTSRIRPAKLNDVKAAMAELAGFVEAKEPRAIAYDVYLDEAAASVTVLQVHPDSSSAEFHMEVAGPAFRQFADLLVLDGIDVYGAPSENLMSLLRRKADLLGAQRLAVHRLHAGFARFVPTRSPSSA